MDKPEPTKVDRRRFLAGLIAGSVSVACASDGNGGSSSTTTAASTSSGQSTATSAAATTASTTTAPPVTALALPTDPFMLGVAAGDPTDSAVILWTRLAPEPSVGGGMPSDDDVAVRVEVASDAEFSTVVIDTDAMAIGALGHSVHVDATGLDADTDYWYRFSQGDWVSPVGHARTFPAPGSTPDLFRFAFSSCQNFEQGFYAAHRHLAAEELHAFVWLGDYIYEYGPATDRPRQHDSAEVVSVEDYRNRYALYKGDADLQACHRAHAWISTWDDHEVENNYAGAVSEENAPEAEFLDRRANAYQVWYEHTPVRLSAPTGPDYQIYRRVDVGDLLSFYVLDTRQYRDDQPNDGELVELPVIGVTEDIRPPSPESLDPARTMLGAEQEAWLQTELDGSSAKWNVLAQQVFMFGPIIEVGQPLVIVDAWDGYHAARERLLQGVEASGAQNPVVLTGDFHSATAADLRADPQNLELPVVGAEFMASSISSSFFSGDDPSFDALVATVLAANDQMKFFDARGGYVVCDVTPDQWTANYRAVTDRTDPDATIATIAMFTVDDGVPGISGIELAE